MYDVVSFEMVCCECLIVINYIYKRAYDYLPNPFIIFQHFKAANEMSCEN